MEVKVTKLTIFLQQLEITDSVEVSSENISDLVVFDKIRSFLK